MSEFFKDEVATAWDDDDKRVRDALAKGTLQPEARQRLAANLAARLDLPVERLTSVSAPSATHPSAAPRPTISRRQVLVGVATAASLAGVGAWGWLSQQALSEKVVLELCNNQLSAVIQDEIWPRVSPSFPPVVSELASDFREVPDGQKTLGRTAVSDTGNIWRFRLRGGRQLLLFQFIEAREVVGINTIPHPIGSQSGEWKWAAKRDGNQLWVLATTDGFGNFLEAGLA